MKTDLEKLTNSIQEIWNDIGVLFENREVAKQTLEVATRSNICKQQPFFANWIFELWARDAMLGIRRHTDLNKQSNSLINFLLRVNKCNPELKRGFWKYPGEVEVQNDIDSLESLNPKIRRFVNKRIAHSDLKEIDPVKLSEIDESLDHIGVMFKKYKLMVTRMDAVEIAPIHQFDWTGVFVRPWLESQTKHLDENT